ncbi:unnamed protein product [Nippostrongylus brasiliensis]|uniref:Probable gamma-butyrobetaine dioxygenase (inferred by orthology to a C. elegans protein) n=1 Tax=Nippostrongylus brasiliensis TaxID=27835 RepID=A0A158QYZ6_NIPBR|nr:unnamed protein product [Nippostrongylus brasiliensis]
MSWQWPDDTVSGATESKAAVLADNEVFFECGTNRLRFTASESNRDRAMVGWKLTMNEFDVEQSPKSVRLEDDKLVVDWDGAQSRRQVYLFPETTWGREDIEARLKRFDHQALLHDDKTLHDFLEAVCMDGIAVITNGPKGERTAVPDIGERIGLIHSTHFGRVFEVSTKPDASNMAYASNSGLPFHTDFPSLSHPPQLQMLHMVERAAEGGNSLFVDGFHVAEQLRREKKNVFDVLTKYSLEFIEEGFDVHDGPNGEPKRFDYNMCARHRTIKRLSSFPEKARNERRKRFLTVYRDTVLWANTRLLHTRDAFRNAPGCSRTLTGCYFAWDIVKSRVRYLRRKLGLTSAQPSA